MRECQSCFLFYFNIGDVLDECVIISDFLLVRVGIYMIRRLRCGGACL